MLVVLHLSLMVVVLVAVAPVLVSVVTEELVETLMPVVVEVLINKVLLDNKQNKVEMHLMVKTAELFI